MNYRFPSLLRAIIFAVEFLDCECHGASYVVYTLYTQFSQRIKRSSFLHKLLDLLFILMDSFIWESSVTHLLIRLKEDFQFLIFHIPIYCL